VCVVKEVFSASELRREEDVRREVRRGQVRREWEVR
jgi:hypothetical protein